MPLSCMPFQDDFVWVCRVLEVLELGHEEIGELVTTLPGHGNKGTVCNYDDA